MHGKIQQRIDPQLLKEVEAILKAQGIKLSQAINMFFTEIKRKRSIPFTPSEVPNEELAKNLAEAEKGIGVKTYKNEKVLFDSLEKL